MLHDCCKDAIKMHWKEPQKSNVNTQVSSCACSHTPTPCLWVGNSTHFACLTDKSEAPQRVYEHMNGTKHARITSPVTRVR